MHTPHLFLIAVALPAPTPTPAQTPSLPADASQLTFAAPAQQALKLFDRTAETRRNALSYFAQHGVLDAVPALILALTTARSTSKARCGRWKRKH